MAVTLVADSGATKCEWRLAYDSEIQTIITTGISPYFLAKEKIAAILETELLANMPNVTVNKVAFYGTGLGNANNVKIIKGVLRKLFPDAILEVTHDSMAAGHATAGS